MEKKYVSPMIIAIVKWGVTGIILSACLSALVALAILQEILPDKTRLFAVIITIMSVFLSSMLAANKQGNNKLITALGAAAVYYTLILVTKLVFFPGEATYILQNALIILCSALVAAIAVSARKGKRKHVTSRRR